jgi:O-acetyl-ADP-ribose deacetylase (regulator of RNase III)
MGKVCSRPQETPENVEPELRLKKEYKNKALEIYFGDITTIQADVILSAANYELSNNSGLALSISHRGGVEIHKECEEILKRNKGEVKIGEAYITGAGQLKAKHVIHVICPMYTGGQHRESELLADGITNALQKADEFGLTSVAIPSLATGLFGFPKEVCTEVIVNKTIEYINTHEQSVIKTIKFVNHDNPTTLIFVSTLENVLSPQVGGVENTQQPVVPQSNGTASNEERTANSNPNPGNANQEVPAEMTKSKYPDL